MSAVWLCNFWVWVWEAVKGFCLSFVILTASDSTLIWHPGQGNDQDEVILDIPAISVPFFNKFRALEIIMA
jgi:hypothetical protein